MMSIKPQRTPQANPEAAFIQALETIRNWHSKKGEVPQVRNLITPRAIRCLNTVAATQYDDNLNVVRFYGGMIHRYPTAKFKVIDGASSNVRTVCRELADFLLVVVFSEADVNGTHVVRERRACLIQAKLNCIPSGAQVFNLDPSIQDIPKNTDEEQFYLLNQWPNFQLSCATGQNFNLNPLDTQQCRPLAKYCFLWDEVKSKTKTKWSSSWQCADPAPNARATTPLGKMLVRMIDSDVQYGKEFHATNPMNDWDRLMNTLTQQCRVSTWAKECNLADPSGFSLMDGICAYATLLQHARSPMMDLWGTPFFSVYGYPPMPTANDPQSPEESGLPVLVASVSSFQKGEWAENHALYPQQAVSKAVSKLRRLGWPHFPF